MRRTYDLHGLTEDAVWSDFRPFFAGLPSQQVDIWQHGFTEMVNNAIDHSGGKTVKIRAAQTAVTCSASVTDDGEGIFVRIQRLTQLNDPRESILELAKGKLTTDPANHSGEGIFFTSRMFDDFAISSHRLLFSHKGAEDDDWLVALKDRDIDGTMVSMELSNKSTRTVQQVFDEFAQPDEFAFIKTIVPVALARRDGEELVSRSQAKRLVNRLDKFRMVMLDFKGVPRIGQAFADQVFRVFKNEHPEVELRSMNETPTVRKMIHRITSGRPGEEGLDPQR